MKKEELKKAIAAEEAAMEDAQQKDEQFTTDEARESSALISAKKEKGEEGVSVIIKADGIPSLIGTLIVLIDRIAEAVGVSTMELICKITAAYYATAKAEEAMEAEDRSEEDN